MPTRPGQGGGLRLERIEIEPPAGRMGDHGVGHALLADQAGESPGVDAGKPDDAARLQPLVEMAAGAEIGRAGDGGMQDDAARAGRGGQIDGLDVLVIRADVADVRKRERDDLTRIGGIGEDLLVAGHCGVEADLADRMAGGAETCAFQYGAVRQHQEGGGGGFRPTRA